MRLTLGLSLSAGGIGSGPIVLQMTGLTDAGAYGDEATPGDHAGISVTPPGGVSFTSEAWGNDGLNSDEFGTGSSPTDYTPPNPATIWTLTWTGHGDNGLTYTARAPIRYAQATVDALDSLFFADDSGAQTYDATGAFSGANLTFSDWAVTSADDDVALLAPGFGVVEFDTDPMPSQTETAFTVTVQDQYGRVYSSAGDFTIGTVAAPTMSGLTDEGAWGTAARHNVALTLVADGTPDSVRYEVDDNEAFTSPTTVDSDANFTPIIGTNVTDAHWLRPVAVYGTLEVVGTAYQIRYATGTAAGALTDKAYALDIAIDSLSNSGDFTLTNLTGDYSIAPTGDSLPTGLSINSGTGAITGTPTVAGAADIVVRFTDQYGRTVDSGRTITTAAITFTIESGQLVADIPADTASASITEIVITGGDYAGTYTTDALGAGFTTAGFLALTSSTTGLPITLPIVDLTTDAGTADEADADDVAEVTLAALWAAGDGITLTKTKSWRSSAAQLQANHSPYTVIGTEADYIIAREVVGSSTINSAQIPVVSGVSDPVLLDTDNTFSAASGVATFSSIDVSAASTGDPLYFLVWIESNNDIASATFNGSACSGVVLENDQAGQGCAIFKIAKPAVSSADFVVTMSTSTNPISGGVACYQVVGASTDTVGSSTTTAANPCTFGVNTAADNVCLGLFGEQRATGGITVTGLSNQGTISPSANANASIVHGWFRVVTPETPRTFTGTLAGNGNSAGAVSVIAA